MDWVSSRATRREERNARCAWPIRVILVWCPVDMCVAVQIVPILFVSRAINVLSVVSRWRIWSIFRSTRNSCRRPWMVKENWMWKWCEGCFGKLDLDTVVILFLFYLILILILIVCLCGKIRRPNPSSSVIGISIHRSMDFIDFPSS